MTRLSIALALASAAATALLAIPATAQQTASDAPRASPFDAKAGVPPLDYRSAFIGYRPLTDGKVGWQEANDQVGRIGGWRSYAKEASAPAKAGESAPGAPLDASKPMTASPESGHGGHGAHGMDNKK